VLTQEYSVTLSLRVRQNIYTERAVRFLATFSALRPPGREADGDTFVEDVLSYLLSLAQACSLTCSVSP